MLHSFQGFFSDFLGSFESVGGFGGWSLGGSVGGFFVEDILFQ